MHNLNTSEFIYFDPSTRLMSRFSNDLLLFKNFLQRNSWQKFKDSRFWYSSDKETIELIIECYFFQFSLCDFFGTGADRVYAKNCQLWQKCGRKCQFEPVKRARIFQTKPIISTLRFCGVYSQGPTQITLELWINVI